VRGGAPSAAIAEAAQMPYSPAMPDPYRGTDESPDREGVALQELGQKRTRLRGRILAAFILAGIVPGLVGYAFVNDAGPPAEALR
jgi:hypothetical protein